MPAILVAVGGASCSGKTTLYAPHIALTHPRSKHIASIIPGSAIMHQDDFAPPEDLIPTNAKFGIPDWDDPDGAIEWPRQRAAFHYVKDHNGQFPPGHSSHDHLNKQTEVPVDAQLLANLRTKWASLLAGRDVHVVILDGFLLYSDPESVALYDAKLFVRQDYATLKARRESRVGYVSPFFSPQYTAEGNMWKDPPGYWDNIVWPAYVKAHAPLFPQGIDHGPMTYDDVHILEASKLSMADSLVESLECIERAIPSV